MTELFEKIKEQYSSEDSGALNNVLNNIDFTIEKLVYLAQLLKSKKFITSSKEIFDILQYIGIYLPKTKFDVNFEKPKIIGQSSKKTDIFVNGKIPKDMTKFYKARYPNYSIIQAPLNIQSPLNISSLKYINVLGICDYYPNYMNPNKIVLDGDCIGYYPNNLNIPNDIMKKCSNLIKQGKELYDLKDIKDIEFVNYIVAEPIKKHHLVFKENKLNRIYKYSTNLSPINSYPEDVLSVEIFDTIKPKTKVDIEYKYEYGKRYVKTEISYKENHGRKSVMDLFIEYYYKSTSSFPDIEINFNQSLPSHLAFTLQVSATSWKIKFYK